jgi:[ribosomal protein S5]-alanine N-acetyltransferase
MISVTSHIYLDLIKASDAQRLSDIANDPDMRKNVWESMPFPYTLKDAQRWIEHSREVDKSILEQQYGIYINNIYAGNIWREQKSPHGRHKYDFLVGYRLGREYRGKGYMTEILQKFSDHLFQTVLLCRRQYSGVFGWNMASRRVMEKCGFICEAEFKESVEWEGICYDEWIMAKRRI